MKIQSKNNRRFTHKVFFIVSSVVSIVCAASASAQSIEQIRWKSQEQVRSLLGEPQSTKGPVGTHANYTVWEYPDFTVAFSNRKAFHLFRKDSLKKMVISENRP